MPGKRDEKFKPVFKSVEIALPKRVAEFSAKPRVVGHMDPSMVDAFAERRDALQSKYHTVIRIDPNTREVIPTESSSAIQFTKPLWNWNITSVTAMSEAKPSPEGEIIVPGRYRAKELLDPCQLTHDWMKASFPTCNNLHEQGMMDQLLAPHRLQPKFLMGRGTMRSVWLLERHIDHHSPLETSVLKTLNLNRAFNEDNYHRHRRDALISERLTQSRHFLDIYGHCGQSAVYQYAASGTLRDAIGAREYEWDRNDYFAHVQWEGWSRARKFNLSYQVASAVADLHDIDGDGRPSVAHGDLDVTQFVSRDGFETFQLSDFNGSPFIKWNGRDNSTCPFVGLMQGGKTRSPEEYGGGVVTEKLDIFAMGNVLYTIVVGEYPFRDTPNAVAKTRVLNGETPGIPDHIREDPDSAIQKLLKAMQLCWKLDANKRASAAQVKAYLKTYMDEEMALQNDYLPM